MTPPTAVKDPVKLEGIIDSDRYTIIMEIGRGCWGSVYHAKDNQLKKDVAIKIHDPNEIAEEQMKERNLTELEAMLNEAQELADCANVVPRKFERDSNGKPFIVMPLYEEFFSDIVEWAGGEVGKRSCMHNGEEVPQLDSGLFFHEVVGYATDIAKGIAEIHEVFDRAHCDIKPDNIAVGRRGKLLLSDLGTSTYASIGWTESPRDNMGYVYTRAPSLFEKGAHPRKSTDGYSFGSILYKMLTGKYLFEEEIDNAIAEGGMGGAREFMAEFRRQKSVIGSPAHSMLEGKLSDKRIPEEFRQLLRNCATESYRDGTRLSEILDEAIRTYNENRTKGKAWSDFKADMKKKVMDFALIGTSVGVLLVGALWLAYFGAAPNFKNRTDFYTQSSIRDVDQSALVFEVEKEYGPEKINGSAKEHYSALLKYHQSKYGDKTVVDRLVTIWLETANESGYPSKEASNEMMDRYVRIAGGRRSRYYSDMLREIFTYSMAANQVGENVIDLEDTLAVTYFGLQNVKEAQKAANSCDFADYSGARHRNGGYVLPQKEMPFFRQLLHKISNAFPQKVRLEQGLSQPE